MPDRYGEPPDLIAESVTLHSLAMTIVCPYCNAQPGKPCINKTLESKAPTKIPHPMRINNAEESPF